MHRPSLPTPDLPSPSSRRLLLARGLALGAAACSPGSWAAATLPVRTGLHGMVMFGGREGLYASHMPMFHAPHDVQAVFRLRAQHGDLEHRMREALAARPDLWTLEPEPFDLNRAAPGAVDRLVRFEARIYQGHFERGGQPHLEPTVLEIERVLLHRPLDGSRRRAARSDFLWIGEGVEHFVVKYLDQRPDIDLIGQFSTLAAQRARGRLQLAVNPLAPYGAADMPLRQALARQGVSIAGPLRWLHAETGDLR